MPWHPQELPKFTSRSWLWNLDSRISSVGFPSLCTISYRFLPFFFFFLKPLLRLNNRLDGQCFSNLKKDIRIHAVTCGKGGREQACPQSSGYKFVLVLHMKHSKPEKVKRFAWGHHEVRKPAYLSAFPFCWVALKYNSIACKIRSWTSWSHRSLRNLKLLDSGIHWSFNTLVTLRLGLELTWWGKI